MTAPTPYLHFAGTARDALGFYAEVFGGELTLHTFADFGRDDGPGSAIAHGVLTGPVSMFAADAVEGDPQLRTDGLMFALLGLRSLPCCAAGTRAWPPRERWWTNCSAGPGGLPTGR